MDEAIKALERNLQRAIKVRQLADAALMKASRRVFARIMKAAPDQGCTVSQLGPMPAEESPAK